MVLLTLFCLDLFLLGGGRFIQFNGVSFRYFLFGIQFYFFIYYLLKGYSFPRFIYLSLLLFFLFIFIFSFVGILHGVSLNKLINDIRPLLFFLWLPSLYVLLRSTENFSLIFKILYYSAFCLSFLHVFISFLIYSNFIDYTLIYYFFLDTKELLWRGTNFFFFKGSVYISVALIMVAALHKVIDFRYLKFFIVVSVCSIYLTFTKGLFIFTALILILILFINRKYLTSLFLLIISFFSFYTILLLRADLSQSLLSYTTRVNDFLYIYNSVDAASLFFGHGFGSTINDRPNIENVFLWLFWHTGFTGIVLFLLPFLYVLFKSNSFPSALAPYRVFIISSLGFFYLISLTNPFINNPIGIGWLLLCLVFVNKLSINISSHVNS